MLKDNYKLLTLFYCKVIYWCSEVLWRHLVRKEEVVATLWHFLTRTLNVQGVVRRVWAQIHVLKRAVKSVIVSLCAEWREAVAGIVFSDDPIQIA